MDSEHKPENDLEALIQPNLVRLGEFLGNEVLDPKLMPVDGLPDPKAALLRFERWLHASHSPGLHLEQALADQPHLRRFLTVLSVSEPLSNAVRQNPELGNLFFDSPFHQDLFEPNLFEPGLFDREAEELVRSSSSFSHLLDRMRYLKQRYTLEIAARDLCGEAPPPQVWRWLSELAGRLIAVSAKALWSKFRGENGLDDLEFPLEIIALGKLGSWEVNYSSDVDLLFVSLDGLEWEVKKKIDRFAAQFVNAIGERMGRGSLYRVDMRLRPFGSMGEIAPAKSTFIKYLENYAETWELMALTRARSLCGDVGLEVDAVRSRFCIQRVWSEASVAELLAMRDKIDAHASPDDFKRSAGGIRDIEFIAQVNQLVFSRQFPDLAFGSTLEILARLEAHGILSSIESTILSANYTWLRQLEHRCQMLGDVQTHSLPSGTHESLMIARAMGDDGATMLREDIGRIRESTRQIYEQVFAGGLNSNHASGNLTDGINAWLGRFDIADELRKSLAASDESRVRAERLDEFAPKVLEFAGQSLTFTEMILSGEVEEALDPSDFRASLARIQPGDRMAKAIAKLHGIGVWGEAARWALGLQDELSEPLLDLHRETLLSLIDRSGLSLAGGVHVFFLGTFARREPVAGSDMDLLVLVEDPSVQPEAEAAAQRLLRLIDEIHRLGAPIAVDLRLRPEGGQGLLVRTFAGLRRYGASEMEMWERFALGQSLQVYGTEAGASVIWEVTSQRLLNRDLLDELLAMKARIETERVPAAQAWRDIKLGRGGLGDIEWLVQLHRMHPMGSTAASGNPASSGKPVPSGKPVDTASGLHLLVESGMVNAAEYEELREAHSFLLRLRHWLALQTADGSIVPENPDKLNRLASAMNMKDGNSLLRDHQTTAERVRQIYEDGITRLRESV